ncbi:MAG: transcription termination factor Rho [Micrococcales bacterium]|nr:transcription termination factor Rho [Micrococcales bacterium]
MRLAELQGLASSMGISGTAKMRKGDLITAIKARQSGTDVPARSAGGDTAPTQAPAREARPAESADAPRAEQPAEAPTNDSGSDSGREADSRDGGQAEQREGGRTRRGRRGRGDRDQQDGGERQQDSQPRDGQSREQQDQQGGNRDGQRQERDGQQGQRQQDRDGQRQERDGQQGQRQNRDDRQQNRDDRQQDQQGGNRNNNNRQDDDDDRGGRRRNRNRNRNRDKRRGRAGEQYDDVDTQVHDDDVLVPVAGILDVLDNYAFVRTSGYLPGANDVYVPLNMVKKNGLRKGDAVTGAVKAPKDGEEPQQHQGGGKNNRQKYNPLVRLDTVNGMTPEQARQRVEFGKLTPLYPQERLRLETEANVTTTRVIDLVAPIGKGQRGLLVAPAKAGKTLILQAIANAIAVNNPECHLMVVLVDERPEEVTDMQRAVKGEVISSTFDRPADDHTTVAELAIERAKRLVEMGHDVVVLLDSITRLGRAYNLAAPASGRILSGGVDSAALYPPKRFFGAARNIENGGSLTILATALVETGSKMDEVIFEEFKGTGNMELKLDRQLANRRIFPAVDVNASGTRREEILLAPEELKIMWKLRRVLSALDTQQGIELLLAQLKKNKTNYEFLRQVQMNSSIKLDDEDDD